MSSNEEILLKTENLYVELEYDQYEENYYLNIRKLEKNGDWRGDIISLSKDEAKLIKKIFTELSIPD